MNFGSLSTVGLGLAGMVTSGLDPSGAEQVNSNGRRENKVIFCDELGDLTPAR